MNGGTADPRPDARRRLRVLLYAPLAGLDPASGDTTYTETLLAHPPPGIEYTHYDEALADGRLRRRGRRPTRGPMTRADLAIFGLRAVERVARGRVMFREPTWFVTVDDAAFDLVHNHIFALRQIASRVPMISSAGYPLSELYRVREHWSAARARRADRLEMYAARKLRSHRAGYWAPDPDLLTVYTDRYRSWLIEHGVFPTRVDLLGQALPNVTPSARPTKPLLGFIGRDFTRKGGHETVETLRLVRERGIDATLLIISADDSVPASVRRTPFVEVVSVASRDEVVGSHLPRLSVLLAPTRSDCGVPFAVIEAMRAGVPVVLSSYPWLDSRLTEPGVYRARNPGQIVEVIESLLCDAKRERNARLDARRQFEELLSLDTWHRDLRRIYERTLALALRGARRGE